MNYQLCFGKGQSIVIDQDFLDLINDKILTLDETKEGGCCVSNGEMVINLRYLSYIVPLSSLEQPGAVVKPLTPEEIRGSKKLEQEKIKSDPNQIISRVKEQYEDNSTT